ncbi:MAG TPA: hypothetical protein VK470_14670, partial [Bacteroidota bacterium]|nr:hypothetical protein [Bacteroidota bacterium]
MPARIMKNVLFITYFWPPSGKASLHWPLAVIKHLPRSGWQPAVLTVDEDTFSERDESLLGEIAADLTVVRTASNDPFQLYRKFLGKSPGDPLVASETISMTNSGLRHRIAVWIRMNLFVPDARIGWFFSAVRGGVRLIRSMKIDAIVSNGPPHSAHLIGKYLSKRFSIPHIPILIDPWVDIAYYRGFKRSAATLALDNYFERSVLEHAAHVVFVTQGAREEYVKKYPGIAGTSSVLYWGYNEESFSRIGRCAESSGNAFPSTSERQASQPAREESPVTVEHQIAAQNSSATDVPRASRVLLHAGNIFDFQNPPGLWKNVRREIDAGRPITIRFVGTVSPGIRRTIEEQGLSPYAEYKGFLPFDRMIEEMCGADFLFVCATEKRHVPGKLFEYLRAGKPVIAFGDDNEEVAGLLRSCNAGVLLP